MATSPPRLLAGTIQFFLTTASCRSGNVEDHAPSHCCGSVDAGRPGRSVRACAGAGGASAPCPAPTLAAQGPSLLAPPTTALVFGGSRLAVLPIAGVYSASAGTNDEQVTWQDDLWHLGAHRGGSHGGKLSSCSSAFSSRAVHSC